MLKLQGILGSLGTALVLTALGPGPVQAGSVNFTTRFLNSSGTGDLGTQYFEKGGYGGYEEVTFSGTQGTGSTDLPFLHSLGTISAYVHFFPDSHSALTENVPFTLHISQSGSGAIPGSADISGLLTVGGHFLGLDTFSITFNQTSLSIGNVNYQLGGSVFRFFPFPHYNFTPYNTDGTGHTIDNAGAFVFRPFTVSARITDPPISAIPEPPALASAGSGAVALGLVWLFRRPSRRSKTRKTDRKG